MNQYESYDQYELQSHAMDHTTFILNPFFNF